MPKLPIFHEDGTLVYGYKVDTANMVIMAAYEFLERHGFGVAPFREQDGKGWIGKSGWYLRYGDDAWLLYGFETAGDAYEHGFACIEAILRKDSPPDDPPDTWRYEKALTKQE